MPKWEWDVCKNISHGQVNLRHKLLILLIIKSHLISNGDQSFWLIQTSKVKAAWDGLTGQAVCVLSSISQQAGGRASPWEGEHHLRPWEVYGSWDVCSRQANTDIQQSKWEGNYSFSSAPGISPMSLKNFTEGPLRQICRMRASSVQMPAPLPKHIPERAGCCIPTSTTILPALLQHMRNLLALPSRDLFKGSTREGSGHSH